MSTIYCIKCKKVHEDFSWQTIEGKHGWYCSKWFTPQKSLSKDIRARALRPDGSVATGREAMRIQDNRRRMQNAKT